MTILQQMYPGDAIASFIIRVLVEISLVTVVALGFGRFFVRRNPALRHGVCICALLCVLIAPLTTIGLQRLGWSTLQISLESDKTFESVAGASRYETERMDVPAHAQPFWTIERARSAASLTILVWLTGTAFLLLRLVRGVRKVQRIKLTARQVDHPKLREALVKLNGSGKIPSVPILFSRKVHSPIVIGPCETTVILPEKLLTQLDEEQLRCVLAHEFTHVRQRDPLVGLVQRVVEAGYWPHPLVHLLNRELIRAREEVCDNAALHGTTAPQYADTLLTVALGIAPRQSPAPGGTGLMTRHWRLEERVKGLLDPERRLTTTMNTRHLVLMALSLAAGTTVIAGARIVAAPNPHVPQDSVELFAHYNPKTNSVSVVEKSHKHNVTVWVKNSKGKSTTPKSIKVNTYDIKPMNVKILNVFSQDPRSKGTTTIKSVAPTKINVFESKLETIKPVNPAKENFSYVFTEGQPVHIEQVGSDPTSIRITAVGKAEIKDANPAYRVKLSDAKDVFTYTVGSSTVEKRDVGPVVQFSGSRTTEKSAQVVLVDPVRAVDSNPVFVQVKGADANSNPVFIQSKVLDPASANVFQEVKVGDAKSNVMFVQAKVVDSRSKSSDSKGSVSYTISANPFLQRSNVSNVTVTTAETPFKYRLSPVVGKIGVQTSSKPTTVTIQGSDIKIEGENIKVVYVKPSIKSSHPSPKTKTIKVKVKDK